MFTTFTFLNLVKEYKRIEGFSCKPAFGIFYSNEGSIAFSSGWCQPLDAEYADDVEYLFIYVKQSDGTFKGDWVLSEDVDGLEDFFNSQKEFYEDYDYDYACEVAYNTPREKLAPSLSFEYPNIKVHVTDVEGVFFVQERTERMTDSYYLCMTKKKWRRYKQFGERGKTERTEI